MGEYRFLILAALALAGCTATPFASQFNGESVNIIMPLGGKVEDADAEAQRICERGGGGPFAERVSQRALPNYQTEFLYLCLEET